MCIDLIKTCIVCFLCCPNKKLVCALIRMVVKLCCISSDKGPVSIAIHKPYEQSVDNRKMFFGDLKPFLVGFGHFKNVKTWDGGLERNWDIY